MDKKHAREIVITLPTPEPRSPMLVALRRRHGSGVKVMKDRRMPRGGSKSKNQYDEGW